MDCDDLENEELLLDYESDSGNDTNHNGKYSKNRKSNLGNKFASRAQYQYCLKTKQFLEDAEELKEEGFIVPDDEFSEDSDLDEEEHNSRKALIKARIER